MENDKYPPCKDCVDERTGTCHATCEKYLKWVAKEKAKKAKIKKVKDEIRRLDDYVVKQKLKNTRKNKK